MQEEVPAMIREELKIALLPRGSSRCLSPMFSGPLAPCEIVLVVLPMSRDGVPTKSCWLFVADVAGCDVRRNRVACYARYFYFHDQE